MPTLMATPLHLLSSLVLITGTLSWQGKTSIMAFCLGLSGTYLYQRIISRHTKIFSNSKGKTPLVKVAQIPQSHMSSLPTVQSDGRENAKGKQKRKSHYGNQDTPAVDQKWNRNTQWKAGWVAGVWKQKQHQDGGESSVYTWSQAGTSSHWIKPVAPNYLGLLSQSTVT